MIDSFLLYRKQKGVTICQKRKKYKVDKISTKVLIMSEYFDKENRYSMNLYEKYIYFYML